MHSQEEVSRLLAECSQGDQAAFNKLLPLVYDELHRLAAIQMGREHVNHTLQTTALVHEAYLGLVNRPHQWQGRVHFFAVASKVMRHILIDHARARRYAKRGGGQMQLSLDEVTIAVDDDDRMDDLLALHEALNRLAVIDSRKSDVVEMRFFGGMTNDEIAERLKVHPNTVRHDWEMAKAWLYREISRTVMGDE